MLEGFIVVSTPGTRIYVRSNNVYIQPPEEKPVPVTVDVAAVVLATGAVSISGRALRRLAELGVRLIVLGQRGHVAAELRPVDRVNKTVEARIAQYQARIEGRAVYYAAEMVYAKIVNQARLLRYLAKSRREPWLREQGYRVEEYAARLRRTLDENRSLNPDILRGIEAGAARHYWDTLAAILPETLGFRGRNPRAGDPFNRALNYGYAILYTTGADALTVAGLDPYTGFLHSDRSGKPSLVYDYTDTYKPIAVDKPLIHMDHNRIQLVQGALAYEARRELARAILENMSTQYTDSKGRRRRLREHIYAYAWQLAQALRNRKPYQAFQARL